MNYKNKYLKYKIKYADLMNKMGGTKEENNNFLLHGTNLFYINDIKKTGLDGKYNERLYNIILKYWRIIKNKTTVTPYIEYFIERQEDYRNREEISLSFTGRLNVAEEYSSGSKKFGEGPKFFLQNFQEYIYKYKDLVTKQMKSDFDLLLEASRYPGIILAINKNDFIKLRDLSIEELNNWEHILDFPVPSNKLYIRRNDNDYVLLLSPEGEEYINKLECEFIEKEKNKLDELKPSSDMKINIPYNNKYSTIYKYEIVNEITGLTISAQYDTFGTPYFSLKIINFKDIDIHIKINIINTNYETLIIKNVGFNIFMNNTDFKDNLQLVINGFMEVIPDTTIKEKLFTIKKELLKKIIEIFPYITYEN